MLTNIFRIGGFQQVSWFQLAPDVERMAWSGPRTGKGPRDMSAIAIIMAHMRLQEKGYLSCWTVSSPTEDHRMKLWIFTPGIHETINSSVLPLIAGLKVVGVGSWCSPGVNEEVGSAFCEALRNRIERSLRDISYVRFGEVFVKCRRYGALESRKVLPTCELMFMGSEEALYVHVVIRRKRVRILAPADLQLILSQQSKTESSLPVPDRGYLWSLTLEGLSRTEILQSVLLTIYASLAVVVAPYGSSGRLTGCCPGDLATQLYRSKLQAFNCSALPFRPISSSRSGGVAALPCHAEVWVGQVQVGSEPKGQILPIAGNAASSYESIDVAPDQARGADEEDQTNIIDGKALIYPTEAVLVPVISPVPARTYLRRCWLQEWAGTHWLEESAVISGGVWNEANDCFGNCKSKAGVELNGAVVQRSGGSSSGSSSSGGSSIKSSSSRSGSSSSNGSSHSSGADGGTGEAEFEADAESLAKAASMAIEISSRHPAGSNVQNLSHSVEGPTGGSGSKRNRGKSAGFGEESPTKLVKMSGSPSSDLSFLDGAGISESKKSGGNGGGLVMQGSLGVGASTPRVTGSQVGTPWDWADDGMGLGLGGGMDMQTDADILAEFGDFSDFFADGDYFGEPPGTAESQALMFSDFDGVNTPGGLGIEAADQMLLPILEFPALENFGKQLSSSNKELSAQGIRNSGGELAPVYSSGQVSPHVTTPAVNVDPLAKVEAMIMFAPGYARVELPPGKDDVAFSSTYLPEALNGSHLQYSKASYLYSANPPLLIGAEAVDSKLEQSADQLRDDVGDSQVTAEAVEQKDQSKLTSNIYGISGDSVGGDSIATSKLRDSSQLSLHGLGSNGPSILDAQFSSSVHDGSGKPPFPVLDPRIFPPNKSASPVLATELDCALVQVSMLCVKDKCLANSANRLAGTPPGYIKSPALGVGREDPLQSHAKALQQKKQSSMPSRIAGDTDEDLQDGLRGAQVGVWRPVQTVKPQMAGNSTADSRIGSTSGSPDPGNLGMEKFMTAGSLKLANGQSIIDTIPLLVQQAAVAFDIALDGECGDGALGWLASQERQRMQDACGPGTSHTSCGGMLSIRHCLDDAGIEYIDPLAAEVSPATVAHLLQCDFRAALAVAFGEGNIDGPLTAPDWCRNRLQNDVSGCASADSKEGTSTITSAGGDLVAVAGSMGSSKAAVGMEDLDQRRGGIVRSLETSSLSDHGRGDDVVAMDLDLQPGSANSGAIIALPMPAVLVGYQDDWLKTSPNVLHLWEKAPIEPYAHPKPVNYYVLCMGFEALLSAANDFFHQLSSVYEACKLGTHAPATVTPTATASTGLIPGSSKQIPPGFIPVDAPSHTVAVDSTLSLMGNFIASMDKAWSLDDFRKALSKVCKTIPAPANPGNVQRDPEQSQCTVVYVISPSSEPSDLLQIVIDTSQCLGAMMTERDRRNSNYSPTVGASGEDGALSPVVGFSTSRFVLHVLPADTILKMSGTVASQLDTLKEIAFCVYSKARRIQRKVLVPENGGPNQSPSRGRSGIVQNSPAMTGMWKDCSTGRNSSVGSLMDSGPLRTPWDGSRQSTSRFGEASVSDGTPHGGDTHSGQEAYRYLYEPLFILADPGFPDINANMQSKNVAGKEALRSSSDDATGGTAGIVQSLSDPSSNTGSEWSDVENVGAGHSQVADLHCCYVWTDDWQWLVSVWTDARGELLDVHCFPSCAVQKEAGLQVFFCQVLQQGLQLLLMSVDAGCQHPRNIIISRLGGFTEKECQEWYRALLTVGGDESRKWSQQLWPGSSSSSSTSAQMQDVGLFSDRPLGLASGGSRPPSPNPASSYSSRNRPSGTPMNFSRRQGQGQTLGSNQFAVESKGPFYWVNSISLVSVSMDHSLQAVSVLDTNPIGLPQGGSSLSSWPGSPVNSAVGSNTSGLTTVKTLAKAGASYMLVPANSLRILNPQAWQFPTTVSPSSAPSSPAAQWLQGSSMAPPLASAYVISPPTPTPMSEFVEQNIKEEWPSTIHVGLVALSGDFSSPDSTSSASSSKALKDSSRDPLTDAHRVVQLVAAQVHALSWLTFSPTTRLRHSPLPFHCTIAQRLRRLLSYLHVGVSRPSQSP